MFIVNCLVCNKEEKVSPSRYQDYKTCSHKCASILKKGKTPNNCVCTNCKKDFYLKPSQIKRYNRNMGTFCSMKCSTEYKKGFYKGKNNPNYRGRQYDNNGYRINHYPKIGRVKEHVYNTLKFLKLKNIPKGYIIHHRNCNIYNNEPTNLAIITESDHRWLHKQFGNATLWAFAEGKIEYDTLISWSNDPEKCKLLLINLITQSGVFKQGELLETPITVSEDNQQPSIISNDFEGSTTNSQILTSNVEDSNANTSALPINKESFKNYAKFAKKIENKMFFGDDIV